MQTIQNKAGVLNTRSVVFDADDQGIACNRKRWRRSDCDIDETRGRWQQMLKRVAGIQEEYGVRCSCWWRSVPVEYLTLINKARERGGGRMGSTRDAGRGSLSMLTEREERGEGWRE